MSLTYNKIIKPHLTNNLWIACLFCYGFYCRCASEFYTLRSRAHTYTCSFRVDTGGSGSTPVCILWPPMGKDLPRAPERKGRSRNERNGANFEKCVHVRKWVEPTLSSPTEQPIGAARQHGSFWWCVNPCKTQTAIAMVVVCTWGVEWVLISFEFRRGFGKLHLHAGRALCLRVEGFLHVWLEMDLATVFYYHLGRLHSVTFLMIAIVPLYEFGCALAYLLNDIFFLFISLHEILYR